MAKLIKIDIETGVDGAGDFSVDLTGFQGKGCDAIIKAFAEIGDITKEVHKTEYNQLPLKGVTAGR